MNSPVKCAKYCIYSLQLPVTKNIIASVTLQKDSGKGSASLELKGLQECLQDLSNVGCTINVIAIDRNRQIAKWIREELPEVAHKFDSWHFVKNIKAKLRPLSQRKNCRIISDWIEPIGNHLFWFCSNCDTDGETLVQMWKSLLLHITNKHEFATHFPKYSKCNYKQYSKEQSLKKKWIDRKKCSILLH